jgi:hypothetical protein
LGCKGGRKSVRGVLDSALEGEPCVGFEVVGDDLGDMISAVYSDNDKMEAYLLSVSDKGRRREEFLDEFV